MFAGLGRGQGHSVPGTVSAVLGESLPAVPGIVRPRGAEPRLGHVRPGSELRPSERAAAFLEKQVVLATKANICCGQDGAAFLRAASCLPRPRALSLPVRSAYK